MIGDDSTTNLFPGHGILGPEGYTLPLRPVPCLQHPHLQLRGVEASGSDGLPLLRGITLEAGATEVLAVMATTEKEGKQIVETIAGRKRIKRGDILLNGRSVSSRSLRYPGLDTFVVKINLAEYLTTRDLQVPCRVSVY